MELRADPIGDGSALNGDDLTAVLALGRRRTSSGRETSVTTTTATAAATAATAAHVWLCEWEWCVCSGQGDGRTDGRWGVSARGSAVTVAHSAGAPHRPRPALMPHRASRARTPTPHPPHSTLHQTPFAMSPTNCSSPDKSGGREASSRQQLIIVDVRIKCASLYKMLC